MKKPFSKISIAYLTIVALLANTMSLTFTMTAIGYSMMVTSAFASDTPKLDELVNKHQLNQNNRNHTTDTLSPQVQNTLNSPPASKNQSPAIAQVLSNPIPPKNLQLSSKYPQTSSFSEQLDMALNLGQTHLQPSGTVVDNRLTNLDLEYSRSGTREFYRDPVTNEMKLRVVEGVPRVSGISDNQLFSQELNNTHYDFQQDKDDMHGDEDAIFDEGKLTNDSFKDNTTGQTGAARGYRVLTSSAIQANNTYVSEDAAWLQPSFAALSDAEDGAQWLSACQETTTVSNDTYVYETSTEKYCQDLTQSQFDYCEVERILEPTILIESTSGISITECGPGCVDLSIGNASDNSLSGSCDVFTLEAELKLNPSYPISSVVLTRAAIDDHATLKIDGTTVWSLINGSPGSSGSFSSVNGCETNTSWTPTHSGNLQSGLINAQNSGDQTASLKFDVLVDDRGEAYLKFRIRFDDPSGNKFNGEFIQEPAGCYDALSPEIRSTNPLEGIFDVVDLLPSSTYTCTAPRQTISCPIGYVAVDTGSSQDCYPEAEPTFICDEGIYNDITEQCELPGTLYCPPASNNPCVEDFSVNEQSTLAGGICTYTDVANCGSDWSRTEPASLLCDGEFEESNGVCATAPTVIHVCPDDMPSSSIGIDEDTYFYCDQLPTIQPSVSNQVWTCTSGKEFGNNCDVTRGNPNDSVVCYTNDVDPDYVEPDSFCSFTHYEIMEEGTRDLPSAFLEEVPPFFDGDTGEKTWKVNLAEYRCDPTYGRFLCRIDPDTLEEVCMTWEELREYPNQCQNLINDPQCTETNRTCVEGWYEEITGRCMAHDVTFTCTEEQNVDYEAVDRESACAGMLPCIGGDCDIGETEKNDRFVDAMVAGSIADNMQGDTSCTDPSDPATCEVFSGEFEYCSWEVSGLGTDCCEEAKGVDVISYIILSRQLLKVNQYASAGAFGSGIQGASQTLSEPITSAYDAISNWAADGLRSASETLFGNAEVTSGGLNAITEGFELALNSVKQAAFDLIYDIAPDALKEFLFDNAADYAQGQASELVLNEALSNALSTLMAVYTVYNMVKLALTLLTACDDNEIDMSVKLAQRQCFTVGNSYCSKKLLGVCYQKRQNHCCYSSILARIIMKEAYSQFNINPLPYGNSPQSQAEIDGSCPGLTPIQLSELDFNTPSMQAGLREWTGLLFEADAIPSETSEEWLTGGATPEQRDDCPLEEVPVLSCFLNTAGETVCEHARDENGDPMYETQPSDCGGKLTGGAQLFNAGEREVASDRIAGPDGYIGNAADRAEEGQINLRNLPGNIDCSILPRPPICKFGFEPQN